MPRSELEFGPVSFLGTVRDRTSQRDWAPEKSRCGAGGGGGGAFSKKYVSTRPQRTPDCGLSTAPERRRAPARGSTTAPYGQRRPQDSPGRACTAVAHSLSRRRPQVTSSRTESPSSSPAPSPAPPLRRQLWRQPSNGFSLMPISCLAVAFSMRSRLPPIMVPCIACSAHAVHLQSPYRFLSTYYCRLLTAHCSVTHLPLTHIPASPCRPPRP